MKSEAFQLQLWQFSGAKRVWHDSLWLQVSFLHDFQGRERDTALNTSQSNSKRFRILIAFPPLIFFLPSQQRLGNWVQRLFFFLINFNIYHAETFTIYLPVLVVLSFSPFLIASLLPWQQYLELSSNFQQLPCYI